MKIIINQTTYTDIGSLSFNPQTDVTCATMPINEFTADIHTTDDIDIGQSAELRDDSNGLWAKYYLMSAEHINASTVRVVARSPLVLMDTNKLPAVMYTNENASTVIADIILSIYSSVGSGNYTLDDSLKNIKINGFCPEQLPRDRLLWVCYVLGAYVSTAFSNKIQIKPLPTTAVDIPAEKTYLRPDIKYNDYVTSIKATSFAFASGSPDVTDEYVTDGGGTTYIVTRTKMSVTNDDAPSGARENIRQVADVMLINSTNASGVLENAAEMAFARVEADVDVINNREYFPGMLVRFQLDDATMAEGYVQSCKFSFGVQARSTLHVLGLKPVQAAQLRITCVLPDSPHDIILSRMTYLFPVDYSYEVTVPWFDVEIKGHRYILRPLTANVTGTMAAGGATATVNYEAALDLYKGTLTIINVDEITTETLDDLTLGVIG